VDGSGNVYVTGSTYSANFPTTGGFDPMLGGEQDAFVTKVNPDGRSLAWSSYLGGSSNDDGRGIAVDGSGNVYVTGVTFSADFPTLGGFDTTLDGGRDAFVVRIVRTKANGANCTSASECVSGYCVDGVCCDSACGDGVTTDCQACSVDAGAARNGTCGLVSAAWTCRPSAGACDLEETCTGTDAGCPPDAFADAGTVCRAAACSDGTVLSGGVCTGNSASCPDAEVVVYCPHGCVDGGCVDAGTADAGTVDAGTVDAGTADAGTADAGAVDAGAVDAGTQDGQEVNAIFKPGCGCSGADGGLLWGLLALAVLAQRKASRAHRG
jgi:hypothetical protein